LFDYQNLKGTFIAWDEISKAALYKQNHNTFLGLYLVDAEAKRPHQSQLSKASNNFGHQLGLPDLIYPQSLLGGQKADTLVEAIEQLRLKYNNPFK
jgi:hypothetical protein